MAHSQYPLKKTDYVLLPWSLAYLPTVKIDTHPNSNHINSSKQFPALFVIFTCHIQSLWRWRQAPPKRQWPTTDQPYILRSNFKKFPRICGYIFTGTAALGKFLSHKLALTSSVALGMRSEGNTPKNGDPIVGCSFTTMLLHTGRFCSRISEQRAMWQHCTIPHTLLTGYSWGLQVPSIEISVDWTAFLWRYE